MTPVELTDTQIDEVIREIEDTLLEAPAWNWRDPVEVHGLCDECGEVRLVTLTQDRWLCSACISKLIKVGMYP